MRIHSIEYQKKDPSYQHPGRNPIEVILHIDNFKELEKFLGKFPDGFTVANESQNQQRNQSEDPGTRSEQLLQDIRDSLAHIKNNNVQASPTYPEEIQWGYPSTEKPQAKSALEIARERAQVSKNQKPAKKEVPEARSASQDRDFLEEVYRSQQEALGNDPDQGLPKETEPEDKITEENFDEEF